VAHGQSESVNQLSVLFMRKSGNGGSGS